MAAFGPQRVLTTILPNVPHILDHPRHPDTPQDPQLRSIFNPSLILDPSSSHASPNPTRVPLSPHTKFLRDLIVIIFFLGLHVSLEYLDHKLAA